VPRRSGTHTRRSSRRRKVLTWAFRGGRCWVRTNVG
jgi:hypothetical protein